ncbi:nicotinamide riboside transporter PnuC [Psychrobacter arenosus]|uniref:nicotinamide riboside transporter PnuC n=1 Tax=Psychrobacter arenosus TaxID=256326 RepID=UPI00191808F1|nr:nicotinamide riboside transporter PnuC [Psychrobacter arenosus]
MAGLFDWLFGQYATYSPLFIGLELIAVVFGVASVLLARKTNILVFPVGLVSTGLFVYLLWEWQLFGDMLINAYYTAMSLYGWYNWSKNKHAADTDKHTDTSGVTVERIQARDISIMLTLAVASAAFVALVYYLRPVINNGFSFDGAVLGLHLFTWVDYTDMLTTALFLIAMYLMALRKIENWLVWIVADAISVPLYFYKGYTFTSLQYVIFTLIAIWAYYEWKRRIQLQAEPAYA